MIDDIESFFEFLYLRLIEHCKYVWCSSLLTLSRWLSSSGSWCHFSIDEWNVSSKNVRIYTTLFFFEDDGRFRTNERANKWFIYFSPTHLQMSLIEFYCLFYFFLSIKIIIKKRIFIVKKVSISKKINSLWKNIFDWLENMKQQQHVCQTDWLIDRYSKKHTYIHTRTYLRIRKILYRDLLNKYNEYLLNKFPSNQRT